MSLSEKERWIATLSPDALRLWLADWAFWARDDQWPPAGPWSAWLMIGGRGAGKTRAGAEWIRAAANAHPGRQPARRIALVGETLADVRDVMIEGVSGLLAISPKAERPDWTPTRRRLVWPSGAVAHVFSAEEPDQLRGPQFDAAWCDEIGKWRYAAETWDMLRLGLRLGGHPRCVATTTPRPTPLIRRLLDDPDVAVSRARTRDNAYNLAPPSWRR